METIPVVRFVTAHGVGVKVRSGDQWRNAVLIPKNTQVPVSSNKRFFTKSTGTGGTQIKIHITQGDTNDPAVAEELGIGKIEGLPRGESDGQPVDVTMRFDEQGRLHIHALYVPKSQKMELSLDVAGGLKEEEVEAHRQFLETTGLIDSIDAKAMLDGLENEDVLDDDVLDDDEADDAEQVLSPEELYRALGVEAEDEDEDEENDGLPMIEPVD